MPALPDPGDTRGALAGKGQLETGQFQPIVSIIGIQFVGAGRVRAHGGF
jgi:hypothetical protein